METDVLTELICRKRHVLSELRDLSRRQVAVVAEGDTASLLGLLATKQTLLDELRATDRKLDPFRDQDPEGRRWRSPVDRRRCQEASEACTSLLREILLLDEHSETGLRQRRDQAAERLQGAHSADEARHAYSRTAPLSSRQLDLSSDG